MKHFMMIVAAMCILFSCTKKEKGMDITGDPTNDTFKQVDVLKYPLKVPNSDITLPIGTKVFINDSNSEIQVELPEGHSFFSDTKASSTTAPNKTLPVIVLGSYTCKCTGNDSRCNVFYVSVGGFGCLHNSCTGSCSGEFVTLKEMSIEGVIDHKNATVQTSLRQIGKSASMTPAGKQQFFNSPAVQMEIIKKHETLFKGMPMPDLSRLAWDKSLQQEYVYAKYYLYGVSFYIVAPKMALQDSPEVEKIDITANTCTCPGSGTCTIQKRGILGMTVHWCEGDCDACVMSVKN